MPRFQCPTGRACATSLVLLIASGCGGPTEERAPEAPAAPPTAATTDVETTAPPATAPPAAPAGPDRLEQAKRELGGALRRLPVGPSGPGTIGDLGLSDDLVATLARRTVIDSFRGQYHVIRPVTGRPDPPADPAPREAPWNGTARDDVEIIVAPPTEPAWQTLVADRPVRRGFIAPRVDHRDEQPDLPPDLTPAWRATAARVARELARDGLLATAVSVIRAHPDASLDDLRRIGIPVDLLPGFDLDDEPLAMLHRFRDRDADALRAQPWSPPTMHRFVADDESGAHGAARLRGQLTRGDYWRGVPPGDSVDVVRQMRELLPAVPFDLSLESRFLMPFLETADDWNLDGVRLIGETMPVSQWAQDNGQPGRVRGEIATLVPRYASRRDDGSLFVPGDSRLVDHLGHRVIVSPLLFQGGNVIPLHDPARNERLLLIGQSEIERNLALGLDRDQVLALFAREFGAARCIELPATSFHIDYDVSVRAVDGALVACVNDPVAAARLVVSASIDTMREVGLLDDARVRALRTAITAGRDAEIVGIAGAAINRAVQPDTAAFPLGLAERFAAGPGDSGVGNLQLLLVALDELAAAAYDDDRLPADPFARAYYLALQDESRARVALADALRAEGWVVCAVPGISAGRHGVIYVNGIHLPDRYLMPALDGFFAAVDDAAAAAMNAAWGPELTVDRIRCAESQRRSGALHCAIAVYRTP